MVSEEQREENREVTNIEEREVEVLGKDGETTRESREVIPERNGDNNGGDSGHGHMSGAYKAYWKYVGEFGGEEDENVEDWIRQVHKGKRAYQVSDEEALQVVQLRLHGEADAWVDEWAKDKEDYTFSQLLDKLRDEFSIGKLESDLVREVSGIVRRKGEDVNDYAKRFNQISRRLRGMSSAVKLTWFQNGLGDTGLKRSILLSRVTTV